MPTGIPLSRAAGLLVLVSVAVVLTVAWTSSVAPVATVEPPQATATPSPMDTTASPQPLILEVAETPAERTQGLMFRPSLAPHHGMLFVYDDAAVRGFWMQNTYIPLDIVFVAPNGTVQNVAHAPATPLPPHAPRPWDRDQPNHAAADTTYWSDGPVQYVIEVPRGTANASGITAGTCLELHRVSPESRALADVTLPECPPEDPVS